MKAQDKAIRTLKLKGIMEVVLMKYTEDEIQEAIRQLKKGDSQ